VTVAGRSYDPRDLRSRIAAARAAHAGAPNEPARLPGAAKLDDRAEALARWFDARVDPGEGGAAIVIERSVPLGSADGLALASLPSATYLDTETTGLSTGAGTVPFLAGLGVVHGDRLTVRQLLLPDYPLERALLRRLIAELRTTDRMVTYNGRGFDLPLLATRLTVHGFFEEQAALPACHDDLLPVARRLWRRVVGGARLADIETAVLGVRRHGDCPGSEAPARYFGYLRDGSPGPLGAVLDHNLQDIVSLARLEARIVRLRAGGWRDEPLLDHRGLAIDRLRDGDAPMAMAIVEHALATASRREAHELRRIASRLLVAAGEVDRAEELWRAATRSASADGAAAWIEVARIRERLHGDLSGALEAATAAMRALDVAFVLGRGGIGELGRTRIAADRRLRRLQRWTAARNRRPLGSPGGLARPEVQAAPRREHPLGQDRPATSSRQRPRSVDEREGQAGRECISGADGGHPGHDSVGRHARPVPVGVELGAGRAIGDDEQRTGTEPRSQRIELRA
jgi:RNase_H superfamily